MYECRVSVGGQGTARKRVTAAKMAVHVLPGLPDDRAATGVAQDIEAGPPESEMPAGLKMQSVLFDAEQFGALRGPAAMAAVQAEMANRYINVRGDGKVQVEIVGPEGGNAIGVATIAPFGGEISNTWRNRVDAWVPIGQLTATAQALPKGYFMERADPGGLDAVGGEGAISINSDSYRDGGADGSGLTIAVIDSGFQNLTLAQGAGDAPPNGVTTKINYTGSGFEATTRHGTGCVEAAYDHCPGATWRLYKTDSVTDLGTAVTNAIAANVDVITHSLSRYNLGWADNSGAACTAANNAADNGMLFFTSAGNRAQQHWQGNFSDGDGDNWHQYSGLDERNGVTINNGGGGSFYLSWNTATAGTNNLDFYLYNGAAIIASSTNGGENFESFGYTNGTGGTITADIAVFGVSGTAGLEFEIFFHEGSGSGNFQYQTAAGSTTSPSNTTDTRVISNAAVTVSLHDSPGGTSGINASYSSRGPSNSGMTLPDLAGPTDTNTTAYGGTFGGTSCATPNNAGAACAFWSSKTGYSNTAIRWLLFEQADLFKDWGANGDDNIYGHGGTFVVDYAARTQWLARGYGNIAESSTGPNYTLQGAYNALVSPGRILTFSGNYPESANLNGSKFLTVDTVINSANFGQ